MLSLIGKFEKTLRAYGVLSQVLVLAQYFELDLGGGAQGTFNVGYGKAVSVSDLAKMVLALSGRDSEIVHEPSRAGDIAHSVADISKAREAFAYAPKVALEEGLQDLLLSQRGAAR